MNLSQSIPKGIKIQEYMRLPMTGSMLISELKSYFGDLVATIITFQNGYVMDQLRKSEEDVHEGRVRDARKFLREF